MKPSGVLESVLYVTDLPQAVAFYCDVLGLQPTGHSDDRAAFFHCGAGVVILFDAKETLKPASPGKLPIPSHGAKGPGHLCFRASRTDIVVWKAHLQHYGVKIESEFDWPNGTHSLYFRDPSDNLLEFAEPQLWNLE